MWRSPSKIHFKGFRNLSERSFCGFSTKTWQFIWYYWYATVNFVTREKYLKWGGEKFHELVTESIEFYEPLRYSFTINSFSSFAVHISNIFNSFFSLRRYLRSFVKSVVKWNMENIADIVHGRDRLLT